MTDGTLVNADELADHFNVSVGTVNAWVRKRQIPFIRVTRKTIRFSIAEVESALRSSQLADRCFQQSTIVGDGIK